MDGDSTTQTTDTKPDATTTQVTTATTVVTEPAKVDDKGATTTQADTAKAADGSTTADTTQAASGDTTKKTETVVDDKPKQVPWFKSRIDELSAQKADLQRRLAEAEAAKAAKPVTAAPAAGDQTQPAPKKELSPAELTKLVKDEAARQRQIERFNDRVNNVYEQGVKEFNRAEFDQSIANLTSVGALGPDGNANFVGVVTELDQGHKVLQHLGQNPDEAARILGMSPTKMAVELSRLESRITAPAVKDQQQLTKTGAPINPVGGRGANTTMDLADNNTGMAEWIRQRNADIRRRAEQRQTR